MTRLAAILLACLALVGLGGLRPPWREPALSVIELAVGDDADRSSPADRLQGPLSRRADGRLLLLGSDELGRSLGLRLAVALGTSVVIACLAAALAVAIGTLVGVVSGLAGGALDGWLMRLTEASAAVPAVLVIMVLAAALRNLGAGLIFAAMGLLYWQQIARVVRARVLRLRGEQYVEASRALGAGPWWRLRRHLLPALRPTVLLQGALLIPRLVMLESLLSFLGISAQATPHSFGRIIAGTSAALTPLSSTWWPVAMPCLGLALFLLCLNLVLDAHSDASLR